MPLTYDDAHQAVNTVLATYRASMDPEAVQIITAISSKYMMAKAGKASMLPSTRTRPDLTTAVKLVPDLNWRNTYTLQNFGPSKDSDPAQVNGFCTDDLTEKQVMARRRIYVNEDTASPGTIIHEFLHFCTSIDFSEASKSHKLLYEGPTEYFTRLAQPAVDRSAHYPAEHHTIHKLISDGTLTQTTLADAYFQGKTSAIKTTVAAITLSGGKIYSAIFQQVLERTGGAVKL